MRCSWRFAGFAVLLACGGGNGGVTPEIPATGRSAAAERQLALVPSGAEFVLQIDVPKFWRRSDGRDAEQLLNRILAAEAEELDFRCLFDLAEDVGVATFFISDPPNGSESGALLLEIDRTPDEVADCLGKASGGDLGRIPDPPPEWSDAIALGEGGRVDSVVFEREDGVVVFAEAGFGRVLLGSGPERPIADDPLYRSLLERAGPGDATAVMIDRPDGYSGAPLRMRGIAGSVRADGAGRVARAVFVSGDPEEVGEVVADFQESRREIREAVAEMRGGIEDAPVPFDVDPARVLRTVDTAMEFVRSVRVQVEETSAAFELALPDDLDLRAFVSDLGYALIVVLGLEIIDW